MKTKPKYDQQSKGRSYHRLVYCATEQEPLEAIVGENIDWVPSVLRDMKTFAEENGHAEIAKEIYITYLRINFLLRANES